MKHQDSVTSMVTLANAAELVSQVAMKVCGTEATQKFAGTALSQEVHLQLSMSNFEKRSAELLGE